MKLQHLLAFDCTECAVEGSSKKRILEKISVIAAKKFTDISQQDLLNSLITREKMGSTGIGHGIAIPHGRLINATNAVAVLITSKQPIQFDAIDNQPVDIFVALFVPEESCKQHLSTLASIAEFFSDKLNCKKVRACTTREQLYQLVCQ